MAEGNVEIVRRLYDKLSQGDYSDVSLLDEGLVLARHGKALGTLEGEWQGFEEIWAAVLEYLRSWDGLRNELEQITELDDERVLVLERQIGRGRSSGVLIEREMASVFTLGAGKIVRWDTYYDRSDALAAAGVSK